MGKVQMKITKTLLQAIKTEDIEFVDDFCDKICEALESLNKPTDKPNQEIIDRVLEFNGLLERTIMGEILNAINYLEEKINNHADKMRIEKIKRK